LSNRFIGTIAREEKMSTQNTLSGAVDLDARWLYRAGGISAFVLVVVYFLTFPVYAWVGDPPPSGVEAQLRYFAEHAMGWWVILGLMVFTDLLYIPIFSSLYQALKGINRGAMLLATSVMALFVALDLAVTWTAYSALITSGANYVAAATDAQRAIFVAAAGYPSAILDSPLSNAYAILFPALGVLLVGLVMLKGIFNKATACLAVAMGITGIIFMGSYIVGALDVFRIINALLATVYYLFAGYRLYRLGRQ
jgi:hypothetical protein